MIKRATTDASAPTRAVQRQLQEWVYCEELLKHLIEHRSLGTDALNREACERELQEFIDKCARLLLGSKAQLREFLELWNELNKRNDATIRFIALEPVLRTCGRRIT